MGLISNIFEKLFGKNNQKTQPTTQPEPSREIDNYMARWEKERQERIKAGEEGIKDWLLATLKKKGTLPFTWESGNDEAFVTFKDDSDAEEDNFQYLGEYIVDCLNIPDAGEFKMNGSGTIYITANLIRAKYSSVIKALVDFDEKTEQETYTEEEHDSGDQVLFSL